MSVSYAGMVIVDEASTEPSMDDKVKAILTQEVIGKAIENYWQGTSGWCFCCGKPRAIKVEWSL